MTRSTLLVVCRQAESLRVTLPRVLGLAVPSARAIAVPAWHARRLKLTCQHALADESRGR